MKNWLIEQTVDLRRGKTGSPVWPTALMLVGDANAHTWNVSVTDGGAPVQITGQVYGFFERKDGNTVLIKGTASGNVATVMLDAFCYAIEGPLRAIMQVSDQQGQVLSLEVTIFRVAHSFSDAIVDPGKVIPSLAELLALIETMRAEIAASEAATAKANTAADNADSAAAKANAVAAKWDSVEVEVNMLPPDGDAGGYVTQTDDSTTLHFDMPQGRVTNATLFMDDSDMSIWMRMPVLPEVGIDYVVDTETTELYQRVHGY